MSSPVKEKKLWVVVEPMLYIHTGIFIGAILRNQSVVDKYDIRFVASPNGIAVRPVTEEMQREFGGEFKFHPFEHPDLSNRSSFLDSMGRALAALKSVCSYSRSERNVDFITFLWADSAVKLMAIPFVSSIFNDVQGKIGGIFFNSRCFRENHWKAKIQRYLTLRGIRSGVFKSLHFLDHGACEIAKTQLPERYHSILHLGVDPWQGGGAESQLKPGGKLNLLTFGAHSERKGTLKLLQMLRDFPEETKGYHLLIVGAVRDDIRDRFESLVAELPENDERLTVVDRFVEDDEMVDFFKVSDVVLCPYVDFHGSSNVIIRAASHRLPVVAPPFSFLQEVVTNNQLGEVASKNEAPEILSAIQRIEKRLGEDPVFYHSRCEKYASFHHESQFAPSLLQQ